MRITSLALTPDNVASCRSLWGDRMLCTGVELDTVIGSLGTLLAERRARGTLLVDEHQRPRYFGVTVFVQERFAEEFTANPHPRLGTRLLTRRVDATGPIIDQAAMARGNALSGLHLVVIGQGWDMPPADGAAWPTLMGAVLHDFQEVHRGFRLARMIGEAFGDDGVEIVTRSRAYANTREFASRTPAGLLRSVVFWLARTEAVQQWSTLLPMFNYSPPRVYFTAQEQDLLREALASGATDPVLASRLGITVPAVKARWKRLFERVAERVPELLATRDQRVSSSRGAQMRHVVLHFVRKHPSELTPYQAVLPRRVALRPGEGRRLASDRG